MPKKEWTETASWLEAIIQEFMGRSKENTLQNEANDQAFDNALVGFSRGDDSIYEAYREHVGSFHWTPLEIFTRTFPELSVKPEDLTVISWVLPQTEATKADNRKETAYPSERWARARIFGEQVNVKLRNHVVAALKEEGAEAVAPLHSPEWKVHPSEQFVIASTWSERHAAYASGLGTFGLCDGLITPRGKAMRVGSVVARVQIPPTPRTYRDHHAYCLFFTKGICKKCISRCPVDAITEEGHDKMKCRDYCKPITEDYVKTHYGFDGYGCGLCQTGVPCESKIPTEQDVEALEAM